jgi:hypothetical protein
MRKKEDTPIDPAGFRSSAGSMGAKLVRQEVLRPYQEVSCPINVHNLNGYTHYALRTTH